MGILDEDVARVREATNMVAVVSEHLALKRVGRRYQGLCPFHAEKTPSFSVNPELGLYHCFGCGAGGDAIRFIREIEHLDFATAVERLAAKANITLRYDDAAVTKDRQRRDRLVEAMTAAVAFYHRLLLEDTSGGLARRYLRSRGFDGDVARSFAIGWAPDRYDALSVHLQQQRFARQDILDAGLAFVNRVNKLQDFFRSRVMFPIYDVRGDAVAFGGRALEGGPKYKNSAESSIYQKSRVLYGLNWAKPDIVAKSEAVICEGYTDVIAFFGAGVPRAVATCGTALTEDHVRVLRNFAPNLVLGYDGDEAGQNAALKIYQWEASYEIRLSVADLPPGQDPADVGLEDPARLAAAVESARPFLEFRLERLLRAADLASVEGRATAAKAAVALVAEHPSDLVRDQYLMQLAERVGIDVDRLRRAAAEADPGRSDGPGRREGNRDGAGGRGDRPGGEAPDGTPWPRPPARDRAEVEALRVAVHEPALVADRLDGVLFVDPVVHEAYGLLAASATFHEALERAGGEVHDLLQRLAVEDLPWGDDPGPYATSVLVQLVEAAGTRRLAVMVRTGDDRASELKAVLETLVSNRSAGTWTVAAHAAQQLLPWVAGSGEE